MGAYFGRISRQRRLLRILSSGSLRHPYWFSLTHHSLLLLRLMLQTLGLGLFFLRAPLENCISVPFCHIVQVLQSPGMMWGIVRSGCEDGSLLFIV